MTLSHGDEQDHGDLGRVVIKGAKEGCGGAACAPGPGRERPQERVSWVEAISPGAERICARFCMCDAPTKSFLKTPSAEKSGEIR